MKSQLYDRSSSSARSDSEQSGKDRFITGILKREDNRPSVAIQITVLTTHGSCLFFYLETTDKVSYDEYLELDRQVDEFDEQLSSYVNRIEQILTSLDAVRWQSTDRFCLLAWLGKKIWV